MYPRYKMPDYDICVKRTKKSDKAKKNKEYNGSYTAKHVRIQEEIQNKKALQNK